MSERLASPSRRQEPASPHPGILRRKCACGQHTPGGGECEECRKKRLQRKAAGPARSDEAPEIVHEVLRSPGQPLDAEARRFLEPRLGSDFSGVRVHTDPRAAESARQVQALAYTVGRDVVFSTGGYSPATTAGRSLLAHELVHVMQQQGAGAEPASLPLGPLDDPAERQADSVAAAALAGSAAQPAGQTAGAQVQRAPLDRSEGQPRDSLSYVEATELLKCVKIMGEANRTYCREVVLGEKPILTPGENFGSWSFTQANTDGSATSAYQSVVKIKFAPYSAKVNCSEIAFVQSVRIIDPDTKVNKDPTASAKERMTKSAWNIDRFEKRKFGWYGFNNDGKPSGNVTPGKSPVPLTPAEMGDRPGWSKKNTTFEFETCAICKDGTDVGNIYGCVTWGFDVDASHKLKSHYLMKWDSPSAEFSKSVEQWNAQAKKPEAKRNDPDQQPLGPFK